MIGVVDFYKKPPDDSKVNISPGLICSVPIPFVLADTPNRLVVDYFDPAKPHNTNYIFQETDFSSFDSSKDPSLRHLGLSADNFLLPVGYKLRPCVIISDPQSNANYPKQIDQGFTVVPLYSVHDAAGNYKPYINYEIVLQAQAYQLNNIFYLPESTEFNMRESFARLDRIQFVRIDHLFPHQVALTDKALDLIRQWVYFYHGLPILDPALEEFMKKAKEHLDERIKPKPV